MPPKISILIPNKNSCEILKVCVESILELSTYDNYEIVIIDNSSTDTDTLGYYKDLENRDKLRILHYPDPEFNNSKVINFAVKNCDADYLLHLNNDTQVLTPNWLELMSEALEQDNDAGAVGVKLYYPDMTLQHVGGTLYMHKGRDLVCEHIFRYMPKDEADTIDLLSKVRSIAWVSFACAMMPADLFRQIGGWDEAFPTLYGDVDLCMRIRAQDKHILIHPQIELMHFESKTYGDNIASEKIQKMKASENLFISKWQHIIYDKDPYDINDEYRAKRGIIFTIQKILYKFLPLQLYVHFHRLGQKLHTGK